VARDGPCQLSPPGLGDDRESKQRGADTEAEGAGIQDVRGRRVEQKCPGKVVREEAGITRDHDRTEEGSVGERCDDGSPIGWSESIIRNLLRIVDALPTLYLLGAILVLVTDDEQRLGDIAANTVVVKRA